jgi:hypothetical protein
MVLLIVAIVFAILGVRAVPRNNTYLILGIAFALIGLAQFRRAKMS